MKIWFLSKNSFYLDSYFFSLAAIILVGYLAYLASWPLLLCVFGGGFLWSIFEYSLHRWVFHGFLLNEHWLHHQQPDDYIGAPIYISIGSFVLLWFALWCIFDISIVASISLGFVLGYLYYLFIHHNDHHRIFYPDQLLYGIREHHIRHHHYSGGNYGITTHIWDILLRTRL